MYFQNYFRQFVRKIRIFIKSIRLCTTSEVKEYIFNFISEIDTVIYLQKAHKRFFESMRKFKKNFNRHNDRINLGSKQKLHI